jgi:hypothetical protein
MTLPGVPLLVHMQRRSGSSKTINLKPSLLLPWSSRRKVTIPVMRGLTMPLLKTNLTWMSVLSLSIYQTQSLRNARMVALRLRLSWTPSSRDASKDSELDAAVSILLFFLVPSEANLWSFYVKLVLVLVCHSTAAPSLPTASTMVLPLACSSGSNSSVCHCC